MRTRLLANEAALADYEILEMLLFLGIPRRDTKPLAKALVNAFGGLGEALRADRSALLRAGLPEQAAQAFAAVVEAAAVLARPERTDTVVLDGFPAVERHLDLPARARRGPALSALLLDTRNRLLAEPSWPAETEPAVFAAEMLRHALDRHATAAILVCNRGDAAPRISKGDRDLHARLTRDGAALSVAIHDLMVIGRSDWVSLRQSLA